MFAYNPTVNDMSGQIMAQGQIGAASTKADTMKGLGQDIGSALTTIGGMYGEIEGNKAKGRAFKDVFKVVAPSIGINMTQLEALTGGSLKNDMDWYNARETFLPLMPSMINAQLAGTRTQQAAAAPYNTAIVTNNRDRAAQGPRYSGAVHNFNNND